MLRNLENFAKKFAFSDSYAHNLVIAKVIAHVRQPKKPGSSKYAGVSKYDRIGITDESMLGFARAHLHEPKLDIFSPEFLNADYELAHGIISAAEHPLLSKWFRVREAIRYIKPGMSSLYDLVAEGHIAYHRVCYTNPQGVTCRGTIRISAYHLLRFAKGISPVTTSGLRLLLLQQKIA